MLIYTRRDKYPSSKPPTLPEVLLKHVKKNNDHLEAERESYERSLREMTINISTPAHYFLSEEDNVIRSLEWKEQQQSMNKKGEREEELVKAEEESLKTENSKRSVVVHKDETTVGKLKETILKLFPQQFKSSEDNSDEQTTIVLHEIIRRGDRVILMRKIIPNNIEADNDIPVGDDSLSITNQMEILAWNGKTFNSVPYEPTPSRMTIKIDLFDNMDISPMKTLSLIVDDNDTLRKLRSKVAIEGGWLEEEREEDQIVLSWIRFGNVVPLSHRLVSGVETGEDGRCCLEESDRLDKTLLELNIEDCCKLCAEKRQEDSSSSRHLLLVNTHHSCSPFPPTMHQYCCCCCTSLLIFSSSIKRDDCGLLITCFDFFFLSKLRTYPFLFY